MIYDNKQLRKDIAKIVRFKSGNTRNQWYTYKIENITLISYYGDDCTIIYHGKCAIRHGKITTSSYVGRTILNEVIKIEEMEE